jgi:Kdo2-lipid IVA lauroyltransferase/acyltransferase
MIRIVIALMWLMCWLPYRAIFLLGGWVGMLIYPFAPERRRVGRINLKLCFPDWSEAERRRVLRGHFREIGRILLEYGWCWFASPDRLRRVVRVEGLEHLAAVGDRPVIFFSGHFTGLELAGMRLAIECPVIDMYTNQKNKALNDWMLGRRGRLGGMLLSRQEGIRPVLKALRQGFRLYYLPDQDLGPKDSLFIPFFGVPAATIDGLSRLAHVSGAAVLPCFVSRERNNYLVRIEPPLEDFPTDDTEADTRRTVAILEQKVLAAPTQYFWVHKRFKTRPPGEKSVYKR